MEADNLNTILENKKFSLFVDEGTDISNTKLLCMVVRYFCDEKQCVVTQLLEILPLDAANCTAEALADAVVKCLEKRNIPLKNIIAMASDNASVMVGNNNSLMTKLQLHADKSFIAIKCICHSLHIVASKAAMMLPRNVEDLIRNISSYFSHSSKRQAILSDLQDFLNEEKHKILRPSETRWLALQKCVTRILEQWEPLKLLFQQAQAEDKVMMAELISNEMNNKYVKAYLEFMKYVLEFFNSTNALFQSKQNQIGKLQRESERLVRTLCQNFMKKDSFQKMDTLNPNDPINLLPADEIFLGSECEKLLCPSSDDQRKEVHLFKLRCLQFYQTAVSELMKRLPISDPFFSQIQFIEPNVALSYDSRNTLPTLETLLYKYEHLLPNPKLLENEWRKLASYFDENEKELLRKKLPESFWSKISEITDLEESPVFENLSSLAKIILTLPHSNAETERIFSMVCDTKSKKRNKMDIELLTSLISITSSLQAQNKDCRDYEINEKHLAFHCQTMYDFK